MKTMQVGYAGDVVLLWLASSALTVMLLGFSLAFIPDSEKAIDWFSSRYLYHGAVDDVVGCVERDPQIKDQNLARRYCSAKHSVYIGGDSLVLSEECNSAGSVAVSAANVSTSRVFTEFSLKVNDAAPRSIFGEWIAPGDIRVYDFAEPCDVARPTQVTAFGHKGLEANSTSPIPDLQYVERDVPLENHAPPTASRQPQDIPEPAAPPEEERLAESDDPPQEPVLAEDSHQNPPIAAIDTPEPNAPAAAAPPPPTVRFESESLQIRESDGAAFIGLTVTSPVQQKGWVDYEVIPGTAQSDHDFLGMRRGRLEINAGATDVAVVIPVVNDSLAEADEAFVVRLASGSENLPLSEPSEARIRIIDDD